MTEDEHDEHDEASDETAPETTQEPRSDDEAAEEEAEAAEQEREAEEPPEQEARESQKAVDKMFASFTKEADRHTKRVAEIAGDSATDLLQCPMCAPDEGQPNIPGWLLPVQPSEAKTANVRTAIGLAPKIDYREDPHSKVCPTCGGLKSVVPAGVDAGSLLLSCADCKAQGWLPTDAVRGGAPSNGEVPAWKPHEPVAPPTLEPDSPEVAALKAAGYTVIAPMAPVA